LDSVVVVCVQIVAYGQDNGGEMTTMTISKAVKVMLAGKCEDVSKLSFPVLQQHRRAVEHTPAFLRRITLSSQMIGLLHDSPEP